MMLELYIYTKLSINFSTTSYILGVYEKVTRPSLKTFKVSVSRIP
jgi:hypothetical protein